MNSYNTILLLLLLLNDIGRFQMLIVLQTMYRLQDLTILEANFLFGWVLQFSYVIAVLQMCGPHSAT